MPHAACYSTVSSPQHSSLPVYDPPLLSLVLRPPPVTTGDERCMEHEFCHRLFPGNSYQVRYLNVLVIYL